MKKNRGTGLVYQPTYVDEGTGERKAASTWWIQYSVRGRRFREFRGAWASACNRVGLPKRIPHDFRRTAVRNLECAGVPRSAAMAMVGHRTESIYRRYAIVDEAMLREGAAKLSVFHQGQQPASVVRLPAGRTPRRRRKNTASDTASR